MSENPNITKEGIEVKPGQIWKDLDKRIGDRQREIVRVENGKATIGRIGFSNAAQDSFRTKVSISRMHKSTTGWALVK